MGETTKLLQVLAALAASVAVLQALFSKFIPWCRELWKKYYQPKIRKKFSKEVLEALKYYVIPNCQTSNPSMENDPEENKRNLFEVIDQIIKEDTYKFVIIFADTGLGKTAFLLKYFFRYKRRLKKESEIELILMGEQNTDKRISQIENQEETILLLDALDEDYSANKIIDKRVGQLVDKCRNFRKVIITCRTQFLPNDECIPKTAGVVNQPRPAGKKGEYDFYRLFLSPLNEQQTRKVLKKMYFGFWKHNKRLQAEELVKKIPDLCVRPMLLLYIDEILRSGKESHNTYELYEILIDAWLKRENSGEKENLWGFSEKLAVNLYNNKIHKGITKIDKDEIEKLAKEWNININIWKLTRKSLLNRVDKYYKFAHNSFLEFLYIRAFLKGNQDVRKSGMEWTGFMKNLLIDVLRQQSLKSGVDPVDPLSDNMVGELKRQDCLDCSYADLSNANLNKLALRITLNDANLSGSNLSYCIFAYSIMNDINLSGAQIRNTFFSDSKMRHSDFCGATLEHTRFYLVELEQSDFREITTKAVSMRNLSLKDVNMTGVDFSEIKLSKVKTDGMISDSKHEDTV